MYRSAIVACAAFLLAAPAFCRADGNIARDAGPFELTLGGSGTNDKNFNNGGFAVNGSLGWFFTPNFEISARDSLSYSDFGTGHSYANTARGALDFHLNFDRFQPFVGVNAGYVSGTGIRGTGEGAPEAGLKFFLNHTTFIYGSVEYDFFFNRSSTTFSSGQFAYGLGLGVRFP